MFRRSATGRSPRNKNASSAIRLWFTEAPPRANNCLRALKRSPANLAAARRCGRGQCRACTVLLDGKPVRSCLTEITDVVGRIVETIESLARDRDLHPVQEAFVKEGAMQCGYCVPGMIMTTVGLLRGNPNPSHDQIIEALNGNICRCCGHVNALKA